MLEVGDWPTRETRLVARWLAEDADRFGHWLVRAEHYERIRRCEANHAEFSSWTTYEFAGEMREQLTAAMPHPDESLTALLAYEAGVRVEWFHLAESFLDEVCLQRRVCGEPTGRDAP